MKLPLSEVLADAWPLWRPCRLLLAAGGLAWARGGFLAAAMMAAVIVWVVKGEWKGGR